MEFYILCISSYSDLSIFELLKSSKNQSIQINDPANWKSVCKLIPQFFFTIFSKDIYPLALTFCYPKFLLLLICKLCQNVNCRNLVFNQRWITIYHLLYNNVIVLSLFILPILAIKEVERKGTVQKVTDLIHRLKRKSNKR